MSVPARLALEDGSVYRGRGFGANADGGAEVAAEVVFNTSVVGYQEILTDPSYCFEAVTFTQPILGIYGVPGDLDAQSAKPAAAGVLCREVSRRPSNWRSQESLPEYMARHGVFGIEGLDTRSLTQHLRDHGSKIGILSNDPDLSDADLVDKARSAPHMEGLDLAKVVTTDEPYAWDEEFGLDNSPWSHSLPRPEGTPLGEVVVVDYGVKRDILRHLAARGCKLTVVPATTSAEEILARDPAGVFLSNGPGDPAAVTYGLTMTKELVEAARFPVFGICLGHQILCLALGAKSFHMKFGHRGGNHPVRDLRSGRVLITAQNHGFAIDPESLGKTALVPTYRSLFDGCLEGVRHRELPVETVQFHPEAGPGPREAAAFFDRFVAAIRGQTKARPQQQPSGPSAGAQGR
ncbi:MAG: glutamine-hydrolyzing carbamoyl-phosphate synthase small subunit [Planctomycetota bacterium]